MNDIKIRKKCFWLGVLFLFLWALFLGGIILFVIYFKEKIGLLGNAFCVCLLMLGSSYFVKKVDYYFSKAF